MTYQTPHGRRVTARGPQHASSPGSATPLRLHARRALRLLVTAGAWGAGLCLIIGSVALVAEASGSGTPSHVTATARAYRLKPGRLATTGPRTPGGLATVARFAGTGDKITSAFRIAPRSRWRLAWAYHCAARRPGGRLILRQDATFGSGLMVSAAGGAARGSTWTYATASLHYLVVTTSCHWTIEVTGRR